MARWTRDELLLALNLYFETPFGKQHQKHPPIIELSDKLGRTPSAVAMKLCNFTSLDPAETERGITGLSGASKNDRDIWEEFENHRAALVDELEALLEQHQPTQPTSFHENSNTEVETEPTGPTEKLGQVVQRRHQNFFRRVVLKTYNNQCCITSNPIPTVLRASHIIPWSKSEEHRLNPRNGLCLSATFDAAFDKGLISVGSEYQLVLSPVLREYVTNSEIEASFFRREGMTIALPDKNLPDPDCLKWHRDNIFVS